MLMTPIKVYAVFPVDVDFPLNYVSVFTNSEVHI